MPTRSRSLLHRAPRGHRRVAALMLLVQLLLLLFAVLPLPAPAQVARANLSDTHTSAPAADATLWVMVCSPQGMKLVPLQSLLAADAPPDPTQTADLSRSGHCLLCQQQHSPALPMLPVAPLLPAAATAAAPPQWQPPPRPATSHWRPLLARAPPVHA